MEQTVFITKYALADGIIEAEMKISDINNNMCYGKLKNSAFNVFFHKNEWFTTKEEAIKNCEERKTKKLASLKKQIAKIEKMKFD